MITCDGTIINTKDAYGNIIEFPDRTPNPNLNYLGKDLHGFSYWWNTKDNYVYQQYPIDKEWWSHQHNQQGQMNGWICTYGAWDRTMHKLIVFQ